MSFFSCCIHACAWGCQSSCKLSGRMHDSQCYTYCYCSYWTCCQNATQHLPWPWDAKLFWQGPDLFSCSLWILKTLHRCVMMPLWLIDLPGEICSRDWRPASTVRDSPRSGGALTLESERLGNFAFRSWRIVWFFIFWPGMWLGWASCECPLRIGKGRLFQRTAGRACGMWKVPTIALQ